MSDDKRHVQSALRAAGGGVGVLGGLRGGPVVGHDGYNVGALHQQAAYVYMISPNLVAVFMV